jgi:hypothetical protein
MNLLINITAFKLGWLSSVFGGAQQLPWLGPLVVFQRARCRRLGNFSVRHDQRIDGAVLDSYDVDAIWHDH